MWTCQTTFLHPGVKTWVEKWMVFSRKQWGRCFIRRAQMPFAWELISTYRPQGSFAWHAKSIFMVRNWQFLHLNNVLPLSPALFSAKQTLLWVTCPLQSTQTESARNSEGEELHLSAHGRRLHLCGVADCQYTGHILQLGQGSVKAVFPMRGFRWAGLRLRQRVQQPQNGQDLLCYLGQKWIEGNYNKPAGFCRCKLCTSTVCDIYPLSVLAPAWSIAALLQFVHLGLKLDTSSPR